jgi:hypothetical protein
MIGTVKTNDGAEWSSADADSASIALHFPGKQNAEQ